jgi:hypothetical protein
MNPAIPGSKLGSVMLALIARKHESADRAVHLFRRHSYCFLLLSAQPNCLKAAKSVALDRSELPFG